MAEFRCGCGPIPSVFKEGWLRLNKMVPFLSGADGVVRKFNQQNKVRLCFALSDSRFAPALGF